MVKKDDINKLYNAMIERGYNSAELGGSENAFREAMADKEMRNRFHEWAVKNPRNGFIIGPYNEYEQRITSSLNSSSPATSPEPTPKETMTWKPLDMGREVYPTHTFEAPKPEFAIGVRPIDADEMVENSMQKIKQAHMPQRPTAIEHGMEASREKAANELFQEKIHDEAISAVGDIEKRLEQKRKEYKPKERNRFLANPRAMGSYVDYSPEFRTLNTIDNIVNDTKKMVSDFNNRSGYFADVASSAKDKLTDIRTWDFGVTDLSDAERMLRVVDKADKGKALSDSEQLLLDAMVNRTVLEGYYQGLSSGQIAGQAFGEMLPFMLQIALSPTSGLGKAAGSSAAKATAKYVAKKFGTKAAMTKLLGKVIPNVTSARVAGNMARVGGDMLGSYGTALTTGLGRTAGDALTRQVGEIKADYDNEGNALYDGRKDAQSVTEAWKDAINSNAIEYFSEQTGDYMAPILKPLGKAAGVGLEKVGLGKITDFVKDYTAKGTPALLKQYLEKTQWHGFLGELGEEVAGGLMNSAIVGDMTAEEVLSKDNLIDTALGLSVAGVLFPAIGSVNYGRTKLKERGNLKEAEEMAKERFGEQWNDIKNVINNSSSGKDINSGLREIAKKRTLSLEDLQAAYAFADASYRYKAIEQVTAKALADGVMSPEEQMLAMAYEDGYDAPRGEVEEAYNDARVQANRIMSSNVEDMDVEEIEGMVDVFSKQGAQESANALLNYLQAKERWEGMNDAAQASLEGELAKSDEELARVTHRDGTVKRVTLAGGESGFLVGGDVVFDADGFVDVDNSGRVAYVLREGKDTPEMFTMENISEITSTPAEGLRAERHAEIENRWLAKNAPAENVESNEGNNGGENIPEVIGQNKWGNITRWAKDKMLDAVNFLFKNKNGVAKGLLRRDDIGDVDIIWGDDKAGLQHMIKRHVVEQNDFETVEDLLASIDDVVTHGAMSSHGNNIVFEKDGYRAVVIKDEDGNFVLTAYDTSRSKAEKKRSEADATRLYQSIFENENGNLVSHYSTSADEGNANIPNLQIPTEQRGKDERSAYHLVPIERTLEDLHDGALDQQEIDGLIAARVKEAESDYKAVEKKKPVIGANKQAYLQAKEKWQVELNSAKEKLDYYNLLQQREREITTSQTKQDVEAPVPEDVLNTETPDEYIAGLLGDIKITPESFQRETGLKEEQKELVGIIAGEDKGGVSVERAAEIIAENYGDELLARGFNGDVQDIRDSIIGVLTNGNPRTYVRNSKSQRETEYREQRKASIEQWADENLGMKYDELVAYEETIIPRIIEQYQGFDEQTYYNILADENNDDYDTTRKSEGAGRGSELLQGEQSVPSAGVTTVGAGNERGAVPNDVQSDSENGVAQEEAVNEPVGNHEQLSSSESPNYQSIAEGDAPGQSGVRNVRDWLTPENLDWAENKTLKEIIEKFGNALEPIARIPEKVMRLLGIKDGYIYSGKGYFIDHAVNHHPEVSLEEYDNIQSIISDYDDIKDLSTDKVKKVAFIKKLDKGYAVVAEISEENGKVLLHKTFFYKDSNSNRIPYKNKPSLLKESPADGSTTISPEDNNQQPADTENISALDASSASEDRNSVSNMQENEQKSGENVENEGENSILEQIKTELGPLNRDNATEYARRLFAVNPWNTLEEANAVLKELLASYGETLNGQTLGVVPFLGEARNLISDKDVAELSEPTQSVTASDVSKPQVPDEGGKELLNAETATTSTAEDTAPVSNVQENSVKSDENTQDESEQVGDQDTNPDVALTMGHKWEQTGEPEKIKSRSKKHADSHDITWYIGKKRYGSTTAERDLLRTLADDYGSLNAVWNAFELNQIILNDNEAALLKKLIEANTSTIELQQGTLFLDEGTDAFRRATEATMNALAKTGIEVVMATEEQVDEMLGIAYAERQMIENANERFNRELQQQIDGTLPKGHVYELGMPSAVLQSAGLPYLPIELAASRLSDKSMQENHPFELSEIEGLVEGVQNPLAVFRSATHVGSFVVLTEIQHNGRNFVAAIETNRKQGRIEINSVRSIHYRNSNTHIANWIEEGLLEYADKKRMSEWFSKQQYNSADVRNLFRHSAKIVESFENPKVSAEFSRVYHGSGAKFDRFNHSFMGTGEGAQAYGWGTYVTEVEGIGRTYATTMRDKAISDKHKENAIINNLAKQVLASNNGDKNAALEELRNLLNESWSDKKRVKAEIKIIETGKFLPETKVKANLYSVEIPDDNGSNYLHWEDVVPDEVIDNLWDKLRNTYGEDVALNVSPKYGQDGEHLYKKLSRGIGGDKQASLFLNDLGFVGISYPANATTGGRKDGTRNYVIFNESDAKITERVEFLRTLNGTVYGWTVGGRIYLAPDGINPNTPVHEYTHLWASAIEQRNPEQWGKIVEAMKLSPMWAEVMADEAYRDIWNDENRMASEVLARLSGEENYNRAMAQAKAEIDAENNFIRKVEKIAGLEYVKRALSNFWNKVKEMLGLPVEGEPTQSDVPAWMEFANSAIGDFYKGVNPNVENNSMEKMFIGEKGARNLDRREEENGDFNFTPKIGESNEAREARMNARTEELANALNERGFETVISKSRTSFGMSNYITVRSVGGKFLTKIRISDHSVTKNERVLNEYHPHPTDKVESIVADLMGEKEREIGNRRSNLTTAKMMERQGKDAKAIKLATGWERGADGKWRYETPDARVKDTINIEGNEFKRREEDMLWTSGLLKNVIDAPGLFEAYPELENVRFEADPITGDYPSSGEYDPRRNMITIHADEVKYLNSILNHEIQHAIQHIEGFAKGGNEGTADVLRSKARSWAWRNALKETAEEYPELAGTTALEQKLIDEYKTEGLKSYIPSEEQRTKGFNLYVRGYDNEGYEEAFNQMVKVISGENHTNYRRLAGEVESRNVQNRMGMTAEERRNKLAEETEDVAREDQIFLYDNLGESAMMGSRVDARMAEVAAHFEGKQLTAEQRAVADVFGGKADNLRISVKTKDGNERKVVMRQGNEMGAGAKHSLYRHYNTGSGAITADDILLIPEILANGERVEKKRGKKTVIEYKYTDNNGVEYTVITENNKGREEFANFYTNRKASSAARKTRSEEARDTADDASADKGSNNSSNTQENEKGIMFRSENITPDSLTFSNNELNLQENDTDNGYQNNTSIGRQVLQSVPQGEYGAQTSLSGGEQETTARLRERIESAQRDSKSGLREVENSVTRELAQENGLWIENETELGTPFPSGDEHNNYIDAENQIVYKVNNRMHTPSILELLDRMEQHNKLFPDSRYSLVGFTSVSKNGDVMPVFAQDFVRDARMATNEEIDSYMSNAGFSRVGDGRYSNGEVVIKDLKPRNVLADPNGDVYVVDAEFELPAVVISKIDSEITDAVNTLSAELNTPIEMITDLSSIEGADVERKQMAKGWYSNGRVYLVLPNNISVQDAIETVLHEVVAHKGLRALLGEDGLNRFLDDVFTHAPKHVRIEILQRYNPLQSNGLRVATEEYVAELAERGFDGLQPLWERIRGFFRDALRSMGFDVEIDDREIRYMLWRSYQLQKHGNNVLTEIENRIVEDEMNVGSTRYRAPSAMSPTGAKGEEVKTELNILSVRDMYENIMRKDGYQFRESMQDSMLALDKFMNLIKKQGGKILDSFNPYMMENALSSKSFAEMRAFMNIHMKEIIRAMAELKSSGLDEESVADYLMVKHGIERNREMAVKEAIDIENVNSAYNEWVKAKHEIWDKGLSWEEAQKELDALAKTFGADLKKDYSGLSEFFNENMLNEAYKYVKAIEDKYNTSKLHSVIKNASNAILEKQYSSSMMTKETMENIKGMFQYYVPLRGFNAETTEDVYNYLTAHSSPVAKDVKMKGRRSKADNPIAWIASMADSAITRGNRNMMKNAFLNLCLMNPNDLVSVSDKVYAKKENGVWVVARPYIPQEATPERVTEIMAEFYKEMEQKVQKSPDNFKSLKDSPDIPYIVQEAGELAEHQIFVKRDGKMYTITVNGNPRLAQALNGLTNPNADVSGAVGRIFEMGEEINRWLSSVNTSRNPEFTLSNFSRDTIYTNTMVWVKENAKYARRFNKNCALCNPIKIAKLTKKLNNGTLNMNKPIERMFHEFVMNGGETGYVNLKDIETRKKSIAKELNKNAITKGWDTAWDVVDFLNGSIENYTRFAAYVTSREEGRSIVRSIYDAKEISVNFNKKGSGAKFLNAQGQTLLGNVGAFTSGLGRSLYLFWNAGVQGLAGTGGTIIKNPVKGLTMGISAFLLGAFIASLHDDSDDDENNDYMFLPEYVRRSNICFRVLDGYVTIPLPIEFRAFYGLGEYAVNCHFGREEFSGMTLAGLVSQLMPLDVLSSGGMESAFIPDWALPVYQWRNNVNWLGVPIAKETPYNELDPEYTRIYNNVNATTVAFSRYLSELGGGNKHRRAENELLFEWNPAKIENLLSNVTGGAGTFFGRMYKFAEILSGNREYDVRHIPFLNRIYKNTSPIIREKNIRKSYNENLDIVARQENEFYGYRRDLKDPLLSAEEKEEAIEHLGKLDMELQFRAKMAKKGVKEAKDLYKITGDEACKEREIIIMKEFNDYMKNKK